MVRISNWQRYMKSKEWKALRKQAMIRANKQCEFEGCTVKTGLEMHHLKYPHCNFYGYFPDDCLENVLMLCHVHHELQRVHR